MISIPQSVFEEMTVHAKGAYPDECCGVLLGLPAKNEVGTKTTVRAWALINTDLESSCEKRSVDHYEIDPSALLRIEKEAAKSGEAILGFYHSHPDQAATPSGFDLERAWPDYSYVIIAVENGENIEARSWVVKELGFSFVEEKIART